MKSSRLVCVSMLLALSAGPVGAQTAESLDFLTGLSDFRELRKMLPAYLDGLAMAKLDERARTIAQISTPEQVAARRAYLRERMLKDLGGLPERTPLNARTVAVLERDGYKVEKVIFESQPRLYVTANLYLPKNGRPPYPAVLFPLGHEAGAKAHSAWQYMLITLAKRGYVALAWDPVGQGERVQLWDADIEDSKVLRSTTEHTIATTECLLAGQNLARYTIWDGMRALDYLLSRPEVDSARVACTGNSGGGTHTAYLSALDDRIKVAAPSCYITSWRRLLLTIGPQDGEQCIPPWLNDGLDHADFIYAFAPKPFLILSAIRDFFPIVGARGSFEEAKRIYDVLGAPEKLSMFEADDGHGYSKPRRQAAYRWFGRWLKGAEDPEPEAPVELETEEMLNCTPTGQVATSLGGETVFSLNAREVEREKKARVKPAELPERVRQLTGFHPSTGPLNVRHYGVIARSGYRIEKLTYESEPGILAPSLLFVPEGAGGPRPAVLYANGRGKSAGAADIERFVKAGLIVLAIDVRGTGETRFSNEEQGSDFPRFFGDYNSAMKALLVGKTLVGMRAEDIWRGVDLLSTQAGVDREKIYGVGHGGAAVPMLHAAVLDPRLKQVALDGVLTSYEAVTASKIHRGVFESVVPGALKAYDLPELVATLAPRPVWITSAVDPLGHTIGARELQKQYAGVAGRPRLGVQPDFGTGN